MNYNGIYYKINDFQQNRLTLVFVHGISGSSSAWSEYEKEFEKKYNVLCFDLRGHGKSIKPRNYEDYEIKHFVQDIYDLITYLNIKKFILISHSFGTLIALEFLTKYQNLTDAAVFLSPSFSLNKRGVARFFKPLIKFLRIIDFLPFSSSPGNHIDYSNYQNTGDWNIKRTIADIHNTSLRVYLYCFKQVYKIDHENFLGKIKIPVLIVHGKNDTIFPVENSIIMAQKIKNSILIILNNTDHIIVLNNFIDVSKAIENFICNISKTKTL